MHVISKQKGATLLVSLLILLVLSVIGIAAMRGGLLQALMAGNAQQSNMAFDAADTAVSAYLERVEVGNANAAGHPMYDTQLLAGAAYTRFVAGDTSLSAAAVNLDAATTNAQQSRVDAFYLECRDDCAGNEFGKGAGCHVFRIDGTGTISDANTNVSQWTEAVAASCVK